MMKRHLILLILLNACIANVYAESITLIITSLPANTPSNSIICFAGNINSWNPSHNDYTLKLNADNELQIVLEGTGPVQFKFTRGSWATVEGSVTGGSIPNRIFTFGQTDTLKLAIQGWEGVGGINSTAAENVFVLQDLISMPQLNRIRGIRVYLPPGYSSSQARYPVLYMHDAQNLFDQATAFAGEWEVDEALNQLHKEGKTVPIVIGIDNGGATRIGEYTPWPSDQYGGGEGEAYARFIVETLKPWVDQNYRTLTSREHTAVMGSSLGGLISFYIAHKYQDVFSKAGVFSPSFWFSNSVFTFATDTGKKFSMRYYMMGGTNESTSLVPQMQTMESSLKTMGFTDDEVTVKVVQGGQHNEALWRTQFREAFLWLFRDNTTGSLNSMPDNSYMVIHVENRMFFEG
jgi:predicted alpha/beta superfamily hydrolase